LKEKERKKKEMMTDRVPCLVPFNVAVVLMVRSVADPPACMHATNQSESIFLSFSLMLCSVVVWL
jgi:hypothetical protein